MRLRKIAATALCALSFLAVTAGTARGQGKPATVKGYVVDAACAFVKNLKKPVSPQCAVDCAKAGSTLVILADDGTIYWPISDAMPAVGQNDRLLKFAGHRVSATGKVLEKGGSRALIIQQVQAAP